MATVCSFKTSARRHCPLEEDYDFNIVALPPSLPRRGLGEVRQNPSDPPLSPLGKGGGLHTADACRVSVSMLDVDEALKIVLEHVKPLAVVEVPLAEALNRTLAEAVRSDIDSPPFDRALRDGYAVRAADTSNTPIELRVVGQVGAGANFDGIVRAGEAVQINTGAPIPNGADAVVRLEDIATPKGNPDAHVRIEKSVKAGKSIARRGEYVRAGDEVLAGGTVITPVAIGAAAAAGAAKVKVFRQPEVAILSTGNELVDIEVTPIGPQIRNSNQFVLESLIRSCHAKPITLGVARDDREEIRTMIERGFESDMLCVTGGVSVGAFDFVPDCLRELGAILHVEKLAIKPGRPTIFATSPNGKPVFALPGNPGGTVVAFELLIRPAIMKLQGLECANSVYVKATLCGELEAPGERRSFVPAVAAVRDTGKWEATPVNWGGSGDAMRMAGANALIVLPPRSKPVSRGDDVRMVLLSYGLL